MHCVAGGGAPERPPAQHFASQRITGRPKAGWPAAGWQLCSPAGWRLELSSASLADLSPLLGPQMVQSAVSLALQKHWPTMGDDWVGVAAVRAGGWQQQRQQHKPPNMCSCAATATAAWPVPLASAGGRRHACTIGCCAVLCCAVEENACGSCTCWSAATAAAPPCLMLLFSTMAGGCLAEGHVNVACCLASSCAAIPLGPSCHGLAGADRSTGQLLSGGRGSRRNSRAARRSSMNGATK